MHVVTIHVAMTTLSQLLARVQAGEEIILARGKTPIAKLVPCQPPSTKHEFGTLRGTICVGPECFEPLPEQKLLAWEQRHMPISQVVLENLVLILNERPFDAYGVGRSW